MANSSTSATAPPAAADQDIVGIFSTTDPAAVASVAARFSMTSAELHALHYTAIEARSGAYCPYSRFRVGCAVLTKAGITLYGANVENASYPVGICAERTALAKAVTDGHHRIGFKAVAVVTDVSPPCSPCGMCRQFIREFCDLDMPIFMFDKDKNCRVMRLRELLPLSFGPEALPPPTALSGSH